MREVIDVRIRQQSLFWPLLAIIFAFMYWEWVLMIVGSIAAGFLLWWAFRCLRSDLRDQRAMEAARQERLRRNADTENNLLYRGDPRGVYGLDYTHGKESGS